VWIVTDEDLEGIAVGAGILGTGGGGNPYRGKLVARERLRAGAKVRVVSLDDVPDDALGVSVGGMGAPVIGIERIIRGDEAYMALRTLEGRLGRTVTHVVPGEVGGSNSTIPIVVGALAGLPVVDADGMGRAFPELQQTTFFIGGVRPSPAALCDYRHTTAVFDALPDARALERVARAVTVSMGGAASFAFAPMTGVEMRRVAIPGTLSLARRVGASVRRARRLHEDAVASACRATGGGVLFRGKVMDVERRLVAGFARGELVIDGLGDCRGRTMRIAFQNENLIAWERDCSAAAVSYAGAEARVVATAPDLICLVDGLTAEPVTTEVVRYGLRVAVLGVPAPALLRTEPALAVVGPRAFGYDVAYRPLPGVYGGTSPE
jgi:DUF917 family protein